MSSQLINKTNDQSIFMEGVVEFIRVENLVNSKEIIYIPMTEQDKDDWAKEQAKYLMQSIPINLYDLSIKYNKDKFIGVCVKSSKSKKREILIDKKTWKTMGKSQQTMLILHELGHCWSGTERGHFVIPANNLCRSIMEPSLMSYDVFNKFRIYLSYELFNKLGLLKNNLIEKHVDQTVGQSPLEVTSDHFYVPCKL